MENNENTMSGYPSENQNDGTVTCPSCGTPVSKYSTFCAFCGKQMKALTAEEDKTEANTGFTDQTDFPGRSLPEPEQKNKKT